MGIGESAGVQPLKIKDVHYVISIPLLMLPIVYFTYKCSDKYYFTQYYSDRHSIL